MQKASSTILKHSRLIISLQPHFTVAYEFVTMIVETDKKSKLGQLRKK